MIDGVPRDFLHITQLYSLLGIEAPHELDERRYAWDLVSLEVLWRDLLASIEWKAAIMPTPARNRTIRELAVNVGWFIQLVLAARTSGEFVMTPEPPEIAEGITSTKGLLDYVTDIISESESFALEHYSEPDDYSGGPIISVFNRVDDALRSRSDISYPALLAWVCNHTAGHLHQSQVFLERTKIPHRPIALELFDHLALAEDPFGEGGDALGPLAHDELFTLGDLPT
jgi:hypothetical protein